MKSIAFAVIAAAAGLAHAETLVIDVTGVQFWDDQGAAINETLQVFAFPSINITGISWDVNLTTVTSPGAAFPSWASEATILFEGVFVFSPGEGDGFGVVNQNYSGHFDTDITVGADGLFEIEFFESFDDATGEVDSFFEANSTITLHSPFPSPGTFAAFGALGLITSRRKRK